jgi:hypothetical protein
LEREHFNDQKKYKKLIFVGYNCLGETITSEFSVKYNIMTIKPGQISTMYVIIFNDIS